jgi:hypothetical protein
MANLASALAGLRKPNEGSDKPKKTKIHMAHPGFKAVQSKIAAKEGVSKDAAGAILASASRNASAGAKKANPALSKVKG